MMLMPRRDFDLFDDFFRDDFFNEKGKNSLMKTDIREEENSFIVDVDLPGFEKENIKMSIEDGYLTIEASTSKEDKNEKHNFLRKERFYGECSRSFYVGEAVKEEDIKASFKNGILSLEIPKVDEAEKEAEKKYIEISD